MEKEVTFEEDNYQREEVIEQPKVPKTVSWVIKYSGGIIKTNRQATYFLIGISIVFILISIWIFSSRGESTVQQEYVPTGYRVINQAGSPPALNKPYFGE